MMIETRGRFGLFLLFSIAILLPGIFGCGSRSGSSRTSSGSGDPLYLLKAQEKTAVALERKGKKSSVDLPPEQSLYDADIVENTGKKAATVVEIKKGHKFTLAPTTKVQVNESSIFLIQGGARIEFRKSQGEFKVVLPNKVCLGIRGTELIVVLTSDGRSVVRMLEGEIDITREEEKTPLKAPQSAIIPLASDPIQIFAQPASLPAAILEIPEASFLGIASENENIGRSRDSNY